MHIQRMKTHQHNRSGLDFGSNDEGRNLLYGKIYIIGRNMWFIGGGQYSVYKGG